jgi:hypothetical protein
MKPLPVLLLAGITASVAAAETTIPAAGLREDVEIARKAYTSLHPGLYRYNTPEEIEAAFDELADGFAEGSTLSEAYLAFAELLASIRCGHTYGNFWNQSAEVQEQLFNGADKLPFTFRIVGERMVVTRNATDEPRLRPGTVITAIGGVPTGELLERLMRLIHADGASDHQRRFELQVSGIGEFEPFDVYQPLLFPPRNGRYRFSALHTGSGERFDLSAPALTRAGRKAVLDERYGPLPNSPDELWRFELLDDETGYLKAGSFVTWKMKLDWKSLLEGAFETLRQGAVDNLILDVRGNGGGDEAVLEALLGHVLTEPISLPLGRQLVRYEKAPEDLEKYLDTWDRSFLDRTGQVRSAGGGFFAAKDATDEPTVLPGSETAFSGRLYLLVDPANTSATFTLARILKDAGRATLVGETTGGNRRGINGGQILFLRLPNSGLEMDIPLIGFFPSQDQPDSGVVPHLRVVSSLEDISRGVDGVLEAALRSIAEGRADWRAAWRQ